MAFLDLPDEVIVKILEILDPKDILEGVEPACRRLHQISNDALVWRHHCVTSYSRFSHTHAIEAKRRRPATECDWKGLFRLRMERNKAILRHINRLCRGKYGVTGQDLEEIMGYHYDVYDVLADQLQSDPTIGDGLSRRYWSGRFLGSLHRRKALWIWLQLRQRLLSHRDFDHSNDHEGLVLLEEAFAAVNMFISHSPSRESDEITRALDAKMSQFRLQHPGFDKSTPRDRALRLNRWLRDSGFKGVRDRLSYRNLRNCLIGEVLESDAHESIPLLSGAIFCFLARRLGITAYCTNFPAHVIVVVKLESQLGSVQGDANEEHEMYLDPFDHDDEVSRSSLQERFEAALGPGALSIDEYLAPARLSHLLLRLRNNIASTIVECEHRQQSFASIARLQSGHMNENLELASYANVWLELMFDVPFARINDASMQHLLQNVGTSGREDLMLTTSTLRRIAVQNFERSAGDPLGRFFGHYADAIEQNVRGYALYSAVGLASFAGPDAIRIGSVVRHTKYHALGVVTGHNIEDSTTYYEIRPAAAFLGLHRRPRWVVERESIEVIHNEETDPEMFPYMGETFLRFDRSEGRYIRRIEDI